MFFMSSCLKNMSLQDSFFNDNRDNRDNFCDNVWFKAKPVVSIVSIVVLIICLAMQISSKE